MGALTSYLSDLGYAIKCTLGNISSTNTSVNINQPISAADASSQLVACHAENGKHDSDFVTCIAGLRNVKEHSKNVAPECMLKNVKAFNCDGELVTGSIESCNASSGSKYSSHYTAGAGAYDYVVDLSTFPEDNKFNKGVCFCAGYYGSKHGGTLSFACGGVLGCPITAETVLSGRKGWNQYGGLVTGNIACKSYTDGTCQTGSNLTCPKTVNPGAQCTGVRFPAGYYCCAHSGVVDVTAYNVKLSATGSYTAGTTDKGKCAGCCMITSNIAQGYSTSAQSNTQYIPSNINVAFNGTGAVVSSGYKASGIKNSCVCYSSTIPNTACCCFNYHSAVSIYQKSIAPSSKYNGVIFGCGYYDQPHVGYITLEMANQFTSTALLYNCKGYNCNGTLVTGSFQPWNCSIYIIGGCNADGGQKSFCCPRTLNGINRPAGKYEVSITSSTFGHGNDMFAWCVGYFLYTSSTIYYCQYYLVGNTAYIGQSDDRYTTCQASCQKYYFNCGGVSHTVTEKTLTSELYCIDFFNCIQDWGVAGYFMSTLTITAIPS